MKPIRIIGVGSPFGQDQFGFKVISALEGGHFTAHFPPSLISLQRSDRPGAALLELFRGASSVILIDALLSPDNDRTSVRWVDTRELLHGSAVFSSHDFGIAEALQLGRVLGELPERLRILGITMTDIRGHCGISQTLYRDIAAHLYDEITATCRHFNVELPEGLTLERIVASDAEGENS